MTTTDDESGLSQLRQQIEAMKFPNPHMASEEEVQNDLLDIVLEKLEAASEKYRQSRKSLLKGVLELLQDRTDNLALDPDEYPSLKGDIEAIFARAEEAKPAATIQGKAESD